MRKVIRNVLFAGMLLGGATYGIAVLRGTVKGIGPYRYGDVEKQRQLTDLELDNEKLHRQIIEKQNYLEDVKQNPEHLKLLIEDRLKLLSPGTKEFVVQDGEHVKKPS